MASDVEKLLENWRDHYSVNPAAYDALRSILTQPAASGEVVAWCDPQALVNFRELGNLGRPYSHEWMWAAKHDDMVPLYATPQPDADTVRDAARYRFIAADHSAAWEEELDAAIDSAIKGEK